LNKISECFMITIKKTILFKSCQIVFDILMTSFIVTKFSTFHCNVFFTFSNLIVSLHFFVKGIFDFAYLTDLQILFNLCVDLLKCTILFSSLGIHRCHVISIHNFLTLNFFNLKLKLEVLKINKLKTQKFKN
jgi:hypothetical protein